MEPIQILIIVVVGLLLLGAITWVSRQAFRLDTKYYTRRWQHVQKTLKDGNSGQRLAIIDADKLVDHAMKARRVSGKTMGERLRNAEELLGANYQNLWDAHKLRNRLVHEETKLRSSDVRFAMKAFYAALKSLGAL